MSDIQHDMQSMHNDIDRLQQSINDLRAELKQKNKKKPIHDKMKTAEGRRELLYGMLGMILILLFIFTINSCSSDDSGKTVQAPSSTQVNKTHLKKGDLQFITHPKSGLTSFENASHYASFQRFDYGDRCYNKFSNYVSDQYEKGDLSDVSIRLLPNGLKEHSFVVVSRVPFRNKYNGITYIGVCKSKMTVEKGKYYTNHPIFRSTQLFVKTMI